MNIVNLSSKEIFSFGFRNAKKYFWHFFLFFIVYFVLSFVPILSIFSGVYLSFALYSVVLKISRGENVELKTFFTWPKNGFRALWTAIVSGVIFASCILVAYIPIIIVAMISSTPNSNVLTLIAALLVTLGVVLFFYVFVRINFSRLYSLETGLGAIPSIKKSWEVTRGVTGRIIILIIVGYGIIVLGFLAIIVGLLWAIPTTVIAYIYIYTKIFSTNDQLTNTENQIISQPAEIPANNDVVENNIQ